MPTLILLSLVLNIAVLIPVCTGLLTHTSWAEAAYGGTTPARGILLSVYLSIALVSALLLLIRDPKLVAALLLVQVIYKITTPLTVGTLNNPVVISNLAIAAVHTVTLSVIWTVLSSTAD
jgi:hypothetical protein